MNFQAFALRDIKWKGCFMGENITFLERFLLLEKLLYLNKCYLECTQSPE